MFNRKRKICKDYYESPLSQEELNGYGKNSILLAFIALAVLICGLILWIYPGAECYSLISDSYELQMLFVSLFGLSLIAVTFCCINNFFKYRLLNKVMAKEAPLLGFKKMSYNGQLFAFCFTALYAIGTLILFAVHVIMNESGLLDTTTEFDTIGLSYVLINLLSAGAMFAYYFYNFKFNSLLNLVKVDDEQPFEDSKRPSIFRLSDEEEAEIAKHQTDDNDSNSLSNGDITDEDNKTE